MIHPSMIATRNGSIRLFRLFGIDVFLHWSWAIVAVIQIELHKNTYQNTVWMVIEYLTLFAIVTMHEFGHALACKSVGGRAHDIVLWPLGGVAYVSPPNRPGAYLWSIVAGPLVNVLLVPVTIGVYIVATSNGLAEGSDVAKFIFNITAVNLILLVFNLLPIYPLDGGQILRGILWFIIGAGRSLMVAAWIGILAAILALLACVIKGQIYLGIMALFAAQRSYMGIQAARSIRLLEQAPTYDWLRCPGCGKSPPAGAWLSCVCNAPIDPFQSGGVCRFCGRRIDPVPCPHCYQAFPLMLWQPNPVYAPPYLPPQS
jgi:Zn-dependent protease